MEADLILRRCLKAGIERSPCGQTHWAFAAAPALLGCGKFEDVMGRGESVGACNGPGGSVKLPRTQHSHVGVQRMGLCPEPDGPSVRGLRTRGQPSFSVIALVSKCSPSLDLSRRGLQGAAQPHFILLPFTRETPLFHENFGSEQTLPVLVKQGMISVFS